MYSKINALLKTGLHWLISYLKDWTFLHLIIMYTVYSKREKHIWIHIKFMHRERRYYILSFITLATRIQSYLPLVTFMIRFQNQ